MYCKNCGKEQPAGVKFCSSCGSSLQETAFPATYGTNGKRPDNYLILAILVTVCCCVPFGIVSIVYSSKVDSCWNAGDADSARLYSSRARNWALWGAGLMVAFWILYVLLILVFSVGLTDIFDFHSYNDFI